VRDLLRPRSYCWRLPAAAAPFRVIRIRKTSCRSGTSTCRRTGPPDVVKAYPAFAHRSDVHGWTVTVPLGADTPAGPHTILVQAVDNQGATRDIGTSTVELRR
jgi:hypothetical protein